jgi:hypothetical protein
MDETEAFSDDAAERQHLFDGSRVRVRSDIEILGLASQKQIPNGAADDVGLEAGRPQLAGDEQCVGIDLLEFQTMFFLGEDFGLLDGLAVSGFGVADQHCAQDICCSGLNQRHPVRAVTSISRLERGSQHG